MRLKRYMKWEREGADVTIIIIKFCSLSQTAAGDNLLGCTECEGVAIWC